jgi:outer membrane lipoprotein-sorting protein
MRTSLVIIVLLGVQCAFGQKLSGEDVLRKVQQNFGQVKDYTVTLDIVADVEHLKVPPMQATMYFKQPEKVHFDAKGFVFLPREGMGLQFGNLSERYIVDSIAKEKVADSVRYRLALRPRDEKSIVRHLTMWVDATQWVPVRIRMSQPDGRGMEVRFSYALQEGRYWLPLNLVVAFEAAVKDTAANATDANPFARSMPTGPRGGGRNGTVTVRYSGYRINTGLPDSLFVAR